MSSMYETSILGRRRWTYDRPASLEMVTPFETIGLTRSLRVPRVLGFALKKGTTLRTTAIRQCQPNLDTSRLGREVCIYLREFQTGEAINANPRPIKSSISLRPASGSSMGAKVVENVPI